jgi:glycosyltransferase involved in cell wall biosynthesis
MVRRAGLHNSQQARSPYPTTLAVNARAIDPLEHRARGGSRPGLTKFIADSLGTTVAAIHAVAASSTDGAIASVEAQTYRNWELILSNSANTCAVNINNGIRRSQGKFIKILAEDDELKPECLSILREGIEGYDFVYADAENFGELNGWPRYSRDHTTSFDEMIKGNKIHGGTVLYQKYILHAVGYHDESLTTAEEYDLHLRLLKSGFKHRHIPEVVYRYRLHGSNKSQSGSWRAEYIQRIRERYV